MVNMIEEISDKIIDEFDLYFKYVDGNKIVIENSPQFDYDVIEYIEDIFDVDCGFEYVVEDGIISEIEIIVG